MSIQQEQGRPEKQGTAAWFRMAGTVLVETATQVGFPADLTVTLVERYTDGTELSPGLVQGTASRSSTARRASGSARTPTSRPTSSSR
jgi:hypothetical protein